MTLACTLLLLSLIACGLVYGRWKQRVTISGKSATGKLSLGLGSFKILKERDIELVYFKGEKVLEIYSNATPSWYLWVGLIIENNGSLPAYLEVTKEVPDSISIEEYFYGPYKRAIPRKVWALVRLDGGDKFVEPPPEGYEDQVPDLLEEGYKLVVWLRISLSEDTVEKPEVADVALCIRARLTLWSDKVCVILHLNLDA